MKRFFARFSAGGRSSASSDGASDAHSDRDLGFLRSTATTSEANIWNPEFASDPNAWENRFLDCWRQLRKLILPVSHANDMDVIDKVREIISEMRDLLIMEVNSHPEAVIGPILDHCFNNEVFLHLHKWAKNISSTSPVLTPYCQVMLLQTYDDIVNRCQSHSHSLLVHKPILIPLLRLLYWCRKTAEERRTPSREVDKYFVQLLNQICTKIAEDKTLLEFFFNPQFNSDCSMLDDTIGSICNGNMESSRSSSDDYPLEDEQPFLVFGLLIHYMHERGDVGQLARDGLLQIMSVSRNSEIVAKHVSMNTSFCAVLATGLSGFWSELPRCICTSLHITEPDEFHKINILTDIDENCNPELSEFYKALLFCNAVVQVAHDDIVRYIIRYFYDGFLCKVVKSAIEQSDNDELVSKIAYFHLCFETVTEEALIQSLLKVLIVAETTERDMNLLDIILSRMNDLERLCSVVLSLLRDLLMLRCEDLMWNCLLRYIIPFVPLKPLTRRFDLNVSLKAANHFLDCIPICTRLNKELYSEESFWSYLREAADLVAQTSDCCRNWAFKYDGRKPNSLFNMSTPEELLSARQPFIRLSSARSSFASTGWNRYFQNRSAHETQDSTLLISNELHTPTSENGGIPPLNMLGEDDSRSRSPYEKFDSLLDLGPEDFDYNSHYESENPHLDYFQFTYAYEGISSESDEMGNSRRNSCDEGENAAPGKYAESRLTASMTTAATSSATMKDGGPMTPNATSSSNVSSHYAAAIADTDWEKATSSMEEFYAALDTLPPPLSDARAAVSLASSTVDENIALIDSRMQYLSELDAEKTEMESLVATNNHPFKLDLGSSRENCASGENDTCGNGNEEMTGPVKTGLLLTCTDEKGSGPLIESLYCALKRMPERCFATNLQLIGVLNLLLSYPQPVITSYLLYVDAIRSNAILKITDIMEGLRARIDAYASSTDGFDDLMRRGVRHRNNRADRFDKVADRFHNTENSSGIHSDRRHFNQTSTSPFCGAPHLSRNNGGASSGSTSFRFTHKAMESQDRIADSSRSKNFANAAILLSQLSQICAVFALQQTPAIERSATPPPIMAKYGGSGNVNGNGTNAGSLGTNGNFSSSSSLAVSSAR